jgi:hypothetical protein
LIQVMGFPACSDLPFHDCPLVRHLLWPAQIHEKKHPPVDGCFVEHYSLLNDWTALIT